MRLPPIPPNWRDILQTVSETPERLSVVLGAARSTASGRYLHWDDIRHRRPPGDLSLPEWWLAHKWSRQAQMRTLPLTDPDGRHFQYSLPDRALALLHLIDQRASGEIVLSETVSEEGTRGRYLIDSVMEEAIASSQIEGASTTRKVAKEMLRTGRRPRDTSEQMILNNYRAIMRIGEIKSDPVTPAAVLELHRILTEGTLEDPTAAGRLQLPGEERVRVVDPADDTVLHVPPPAEQLPERLQALCDFASSGDGEPFVHPVRPHLNSRQLPLLSHALRHPDGDYTYQSHARSHRVARQSARKDLLALQGKGYLTVTRVARAMHFRPARDLAARVTTQPGVD